LGDAINDDRDPNLPESHTTPLDLNTETGKLQRLAKNIMKLSCSIPINSKDLCYKFSLSNFLRNGNGFCFYT